MIDAPVPRIGKFAGGKKPSKAGPRSLPMRKPPRPRKLKVLLPRGVPPGLINR